MADLLDPDDQVSIRDLILVVVVLAIFHFGLTYLTIIAAQRARAAMEMSKVERAIHGQVLDRDGEVYARHESERQGALQTLLSFPVIYFAYKPPDSRWHSGAEIPPTVYAFNSLAAAMIMQMFGMLGAQLMPQHHRWRRFLEGRGIHEKGGIPKELDRVPLFRAARWLEKLQSKRYGIAIVVSFFHFFLSIAAHIAFIGEQVAPSGAIWPKLTFQLLHFPVATTFIPAGGWERLPPATAGVLTLANSCAVGLVIQCLIELLRKWIDQRLEDL